jgi:hypothetical protein
MFTKKLLYSDTVVSSPGRRFRLNYYITDDSSKLAESRAAYGIMIEKEGGPETEVYEAASCMRSYAEAERILASLCANTVSPVCAEEAMEMVLLRENSDESSSASVA